MRATCQFAVMITSVAASIAFAAAQTPWERYISQPTPENAKQVSQIAYAEPTVEPEQGERDLALLAVQVLSSDIEAVRLAFRLRSKADGHLGETLDIMLGRLIRTDPHLFLTTLREQPGPVVRLDSLVGNFGDEFVDRDAAHLYEAERRRASLLRVTDRDLVAVRNKCVAALKGDT